MNNESYASIVRPIDVGKFSPEGVPNMVGNLREHIYQVALPKGDLRPGQVSGLTAGLELFESGERFINLEMPPRYGKTRLMEEFGNGLGGRQIYITPGETATENLDSKLRSKYDFGRIDKDHKEYGHEITAITMPMLQRIFKEIPTTTDRTLLKNAQAIFGADVIFLDEVHHYLNPQALQVLTTFLRHNPESLMIGATATSSYDEEKNVERLLGKSAAKKSLFEAVEENVLLSPKVKIIKTGMSLDQERKTPEGNYIFSEATYLGKRDSLLIDGYLDACKRDGRMLRMIAYLTSIPHANNFVENARKKGINVELITGATKNRKRIYENLSDDKINLVATIGTAIESIDIPSLEGILDGAPSQSRRLVFQKWARPLTALDGKCPPWIIQAVDDATSYKNKPLLVTEMLGVNEFVNNSVVRPKPRAFPDKYLPPKLGSSVEEQTETNEDLLSFVDATMQLQVGQEVDLEAETINIASLFRMGILDKAELLTKGSLPNTEIEKLKSTINTFLEQNFEGKLPGRSVQLLSGIRLYDEVVDEYISLSVIFSRMIGIPLENLKASDVATVEAFLCQGSFPSDEISQKEDFVDAEFLELCQKFREDSINEDEKIMLASVIRPVLEEASKLGMLSAVGVLRSFKHNSGKYQRSVDTLSSALGLSNTYGERKFTANDRDRLVSFVEKYSQGQPLLMQKDTRQLLVVPIVHPIYGDVRSLLRDIFENAKSQGYGFNTSALSGYTIENERFSGSLLTLANRLGIRQKSKSSITALEIKSLLHAAGMLEEK